HTFYNSGDHYVYMIATSEEGCSDTAHLKIYIEPFIVFIPNSFTPNEDGMNDVFMSESYLEPKEWEFKIYNRWGEKIYETTDYQFKWDGKYKGELVPFGLYNY